MYRRVISTLALVFGLFVVFPITVQAAQCPTAGATQCVGGVKQYCPASGAQWLPIGSCATPKPATPKPTPKPPTPVPPTMPPVVTAPPVGPTAPPATPKPCGVHPNGSQWISLGCTYMCRNGLTIEISCNPTATLPPTTPRPSGLPTPPPVITAPPVGTPQPTSGASCGIHPHNSFWRQGACWNTCVNGVAHETLDCQKPSTSPSPTSIPAGGSTKACTAITNAFECGYTPDCLWSNNKCVTKGEIASYALGTCTSPCPLNGSCTCPAGCALNSVSLGSGGTCGGQIVTLNCSALKGIAVCQANPSCTWSSFSDITANGFCTNKPTPINSCIQVCDSTTGVCACPVGCSKTFAQNGLNCGGTKPTITCNANEWQCGNQCAEGAQQTSFNNVWCNGEARWKYESQMAQGGQVFCYGNSSVKRADSNNCTTITGQIAACGQYTTVSMCESPGRLCQYDYANNKCLPLTCIADWKIKSVGSTKPCCSGNATYQENGQTYCGNKPNYVPQEVPLFDQNTTCEQNAGNMIACITAGCRYFGDTKSCVPYGKTNKCSGGFSECVNVGDSCVSNFQQVGLAGICGRDSTITDNSCLCKNNPTLTNPAVKTGQFCTGVSQCVCNQSILIDPGIYCGPKIAADDFCRQSPSCICNSSGQVIPFGAQCRPFEPGLQQWIDRTNALRLACSNGQLGGLQCIGLGLYQSADALSLGGVSATNASIDSYKLCIKEYGEGKRSSCVLEAALVIFNAGGVSQTLIGWAKFVMALPQNIVNTFQFAFSGSTISTTLPANVVDDIVAASGKITPDLFKKDFISLLNLCPTCETEYELYMFLKSQGLLTDTAGAYGIAIGSGSSATQNVIFSGVADGTSERVANTWATQIAHPGELVVDAHGWLWPNGTYRFEVQQVVNGQVESILMDAEEMAQYLIEGGYVSGDTSGVVLVTCFAASCPTNSASSSLAAQLAKELNLPVTAAASEVGTVEGVAAFHGSLSTFGPDGNFIGYRLMGE
jgi:hypothetical protein